MSDIVLPYYGLSDNKEYVGDDLDILLGFVSIYQKYMDRVYFPFENGALLAIEWVDEELKIPDNLWDLISDSVSRVVAIPLILYNTDDVYSHMTIIVYDKQRLEVQRFDPNGENNNEYNEMILDERLKFEFWDNISTSLHYIRPDDTCPVQAYQDIHYTDKYNEGYCSAWCFWYLELRLSNMDIDPYELEKRAYDILSNSKESLLEFIRGYSYFIIRMKDRIKESLLSRGFEYNERNIKKYLYELLPLNLSNLIKNLKLN